MKKYQQIPVVVDAAQWDGSKESMKKIISDFAVMHNDISYNEDGKVKAWFTGEQVGRLFPVAVDSFFVKSALGQLTLMSPEDFNKTYVAE
jgi:hypothetical protein